MARRSIGRFGILGVVGVSALIASRLLLTEGPVDGYIVEASPSPIFSPESGGTGRLETIEVDRRARSGGRDNAKGTAAGLKLLPGRSLGDRPNSDFAIRVGAATRASYPGDYDAAISRIAREDVVQCIMLEVESSAAQMCGFESWDRLQALLTSSSHHAIAIRPQLLALSDAALEVAAELPEVYREAWDRADCLEIVDPGDENYSHEDWRRVNGNQRDLSLLSMSSSIRVGDRDFFLHMDSYKFPSFEARLAHLKAMKEGVWAQIGMPK